MVDPRRVGLAIKADHWLRVRPGTDAALALGLVHVMLERGWYDEEFVRSWTNAPLLVRADTGDLLRASELAAAGKGTGFVAWDTLASAPVPYAPERRAYPVREPRLALRGTFEVAMTDGVVTCRPVLEDLRLHCLPMSPAAAEAITGVAADEIERTAETLWASRPVAFYSWSGLEQHHNTTQIIRAINVLYALTGSLDVPGGNGCSPRCRPTQSTATAS